ncbi:hypothetical protein, partial [uncultured Rikenella sp.]|uniref:hypothetical protein n=1 Tax=uncultured Rikenella sp. TaxID=368003 RepID=UPI00260CAA18
AGLAECQPAEYAYFRRAGDGFLRGIVFFARCSLSARLGDSFSFGLSPKELNRFFRRGARLVIAPAGTVLFVNKENQKNFRRMLTHPQATDGPTLCHAQLLEIIKAARRGAKASAGRFAGRLYPK